MGKMNWQASKAQGRQAADHIRQHHAIVPGANAGDPAKQALAARCDGEFRRSGGKRRRSTISIGDLQAANLSTRTHIKITLPRLKFLEGNDG